MCQRSAGCAARLVLGAGCHFHGQMGQIAVLHSSGVSPPHSPGSAPAEQCLRCRHAAGCGTVLWHGWRCLSVPAAQLDAGTAAGSHPSCAVLCDKLISPYKFLVFEVEIVYRENSWSLVPAPAASAVWARPRGRSAARCARGSACWQRVLFRARSAPRQRVPSQSARFAGGQEFGWGNRAGLNNFCSQYFEELPFTSDALPLPCKVPVPAASRARGRRPGKLYQPCWEQNLERFDPALERTSPVRSLI